MSSPEKDKIRIKHILQAIKYIEVFVKGSDLKSFVKDYLLQSAVIRQVEIIGEASNNISRELREKFPDVSWKEIRGFRNLLIHEYFRVDSMELWETITEDLPVLKKQMNSMLRKQFGRK